MSEEGITMLKSSKACPHIKYKSDPKCIHKWTEGVAEYIMYHQILSTKEHIGAMSQFHI